MTPEQILPWKHELIASLQPLVDAFNANCLQARPTQSIETFDTRKNALGVQIVKPEHPSCFLEVTLELGRHPAIVTYCSRYRARDLQRETTEKFLILSGVGAALSIDEVNGPINANEFAELVMRYFTID